MVDHWSSKAAKALYLVSYTRERIDTLDFDKFVIDSYSNLIVLLNLTNEYISTLLLKDPKIAPQAIEILGRLNDYIDSVCQLRRNQRLLGILQSIIEPWKELIKSGTRHNKNIVFLETNQMVHRVIPLRRQIFSMLSGICDQTGYNDVKLLPNSLKRAPHVECIYIPKIQASNISSLAIVFHEIGHQVASNILIKNEERIDKAISQTVKEIAKGDKTDHDIRDILRAMSEELLADLFAYLIVGPAIAIALHEEAMHKRENPWSVHFSTGNMLDSAHPSLGFRLQCLSEFNGFRTLCVHMGTIAARKECKESMVRIINNISNKLLRDCEPGASKVVVRHNDHRISRILQEKLSQRQLKYMKEALRKSVHLVQEDLQRFVWRIKGNNVLFSPKLKESTGSENEYVEQVGHLIEAINSAHEDIHLRSSPRKMPVEKVLLIASLCRFIHMESWFPKPESCIEYHLDLLEQWAWKSAGF